MAANFLLRIEKGVTSSVNYLIVFSFDDIQALCKKALLIACVQCLILIIISTDSAAVMMHVCGMKVLPLGFEVVAGCLPTH